MTALELLADLRRRGVMLRAEGDRLCGDAPKGILTPKDRAALAEHKTAIMRLLRSEAVESPVTVVDILAAFRGARVIAEFAPGACLLHDPRAGGARGPWGRTQCGRCRGTVWHFARGQFLCTICHPPGSEDAPVPYADIAPPQIRDSSPAKPPALRRTRR